MMCGLGWGWGGGIEVWSMKEREMCGDRRVIDISRYPKLFFQGRRSEGGVGKKSPATPMYAQLDQTQRVPE